MSLLLLLTVLVVGPIAQDPIYERGPGITMPTPVREVKPQYTPRAMKEGVQGRVVLRCVVGKEGRPSSVEVVESLHPELDNQAVNAMKQWEFKPGTRDGAPVAVRVEVEMTFTLK